MSTARFRVSVAQLPNERSAQQVTSGSASGSGPKRRLRPVTSVGRMRMWRDLVLATHGRSPASSAAAMSAAVRM